MTRSAVIERHRQQRIADPRRLTDEWFPEQRKFYDSKARLLAALCGRRAGKTRGLAAHFVREAATKRGARLLYINHTLDECRRLFWIGNAQDGVYELVKRNNINAIPDRTRLTLTFPDTDSTIELRGAKDEVELSKALGAAYTEIAWDEAQKIRPSMAPTIREVLMPTLLDHAGRLRYTGTANRQQSGLFWELSQPKHADRTLAFELHEWSMLANPHFGRARIHDDGTWWVYALKLDAPISGPHTEGEITAAVAGARMKYGIEQLAHDLGVPLDSPIVQREGFGRWCAEDDAYVYAIRKARDPYYAPARMRDDGFPDIPACLADLPGDWREYTFSMGGDLGFRDAFALHCWAWRGTDPNLYEVFSWARSGLDSDQQFNAIKEVRAILPVGQIVVDSGGIGLQVSTAWSKVFVERYNLPIVPAEKHEKHSFQAIYNTDIAKGRCRFREGGETTDEMMQLQWSKLVTGTGRQVEDPTQDNHCCFVAGTLVQTDDGEAAIETIKSGGRVMTRGGMREVIDSMCNGVKETWRLITEAGRQIEGTGNHPIYTSDGWIRLDELILGSTLFASPARRYAACDVTPNAGETAESTTRTGSVQSAAKRFASTDIASSAVVLDRVARVERTGRVASVYNLSVDGEHEYFANGILVHNCDASLYSHRASYAYRSRPEDAKPVSGTPAAFARQAAELEEDLDEEFDQPWRRRGMT